jgi:hypothetical protein
LVNELALPVGVPMPASGWMLSVIPADVDDSYVDSLTVGESTGDWATESGYSVSFPKAKTRTAPFGRSDGLDRPKPASCELRKRRLAVATQQDIACV